ncbi:hypothetical protein RHMOL_Rhmol13G0111900 [Rhododendron molle]|uniref:Uncharacterized protein n=1 Tax=Rhododendron molle TaxID=49168 RepID=A0ACC0L6S3_RHOML|nr:hypothetical protein RHMOL_Rhmol13G0111900 [Rhododendron molle]
MGEVSSRSSIGFVGVVFTISEKIVNARTSLVDAKAMDKIRLESLTDKSKLDPQLELFIRIVPDNVNKTLSIIDSGIRMKPGLACFCSVLFDFVRLSSMTINSVGNPLPPSSLPTKHHYVARIAHGLLKFDFF